MQRYRVERTRHFDVGVHVHLTRTALEEPEVFRRAGLKRGQIALEVMRVYLPPRGAVDARTSPPLIPVPQVLVVLVERLETLAFPIRVVLAVPSRALLLTILLGMVRARRQRHEAPVRRERQIAHVAVGIELAGTRHTRRHVVVANHPYHATEIAEGPLMKVQKRGEIELPDCLFIAMPRIAKRHPEDPRPLVAARLRMPRRRTLEVVDLSFFPRRVVHHADHQLRYARLQMADIALHGIVAADVTVALDEVLINHLSTVAGRDRIGDFLLEGGRYERAALRAAR